MNRERAKELLPIIEAFANGEDIQLQYSDGSWRSDNHMDFSCDLDKYRIKPKPREWWIVNVTNRSDRYPHVLSPEEKEKHFADSMRYIKVREVLE